MKKDFEKIRRRGYDIAEFARVVQKLLNAEPLEERYRDHALFGTFPHRHAFGLVQKVRGARSYPASASTGSSFAARLAGFRPKNTPTNTLNTNDTTHALA
ncbi:MAG: type II toxin-antitoxin system mRNA interferase toxin, RelE/StbE family [Treponema sp.]|nr:type II toxin-antitoxin system mRNA interferase toxin, RelE/StbE family [Treponema sp.]